jgi:hypothetical protein
MRFGIRRSRRFSRVALAACLSFLTLCAPLMIVCEGVEHSATEWIFSNCCDFADRESSFHAGLAPAAAPVTTPTPDGRCSDACVDTFLLACAPEPSAPPHSRLLVSAVRIGDTSAMTEPAGFERAQDAPGPPRLPSVAALSTVLLI